MTNIRAIVPAAGKGKRLQKISGDMPKAMFKVNGRPMLEIAIENIGFIKDEDSFAVCMPAGVAVLITDER